MTPAIAAADLAELYAGQPMVLVLEGCDAAALALPGLVAWQVTRADGTLCLHRPATLPAFATVPVPLPPASVLAIIAPDAAAAAPLLAWWAAAGPDVPPLLEAANAEAALPGLARLAIAALGSQARRAAGLHRALVAARQDAEESREAMVSLIQNSIHAAEPAPPTRILSLTPSTAGQVIQASDGRLAAGQDLGLPLESLSGLALHLAEGRAAPGALLRVRLYGAESGRIVGAWLVPGAALVPGWLTLELPTPIGPLRETACLDLAAELEAGDILALSLDQAQCSADRAVAVQDEVPSGDLGRALALRVWSAPFGRRFVLAQHWDAEAVDLALAPFGMPPAVPARLPAQLWEGARYPAGQVEKVALGSEAPRLLASFGAGRRVVLVLPGVPVNGLDLLQAVVTVGRGDPALLDAALWLQPDEAQVATEADLSLEHPGTRWSGWRSPPAQGGAFRLPLALPLQGPRSVTVVLVLRHLGKEPGQPLRVEWTDLVGLRGHCPPPRPMPRQPLPPPPPLEAVLALATPTIRLPPPAPAPAPAPTSATPSAPGTGGGADMALARLHEHFATPDGGYRHLDVWLEDVHAGQFRWPRLRFKFALRGEGPVIEFRRRADWPAMFSGWPGTEGDAWGPYLLLRESDLAGDLAALLPAEPDRRMLTALIQLLPRAVGQVLRETPATAGDAATWLDPARRLAAALRQPA